MVAKNTFRGGVSEREFDGGKNKNTAIAAHASSKFHFYQKFHRVRFARVRDFRARFAHDGVSPGKRKVQLQRRDGTVTRGRVEVIDKFCFVEKGDAFDGIVVVVVIVGECEY